MKLSIWLGLFALLTFNAFPAFAQDGSESNGNSRFVLTLNDSLVNSLKSLGLLQSEVRADAQGEIAAIQIQFAESADQNPNRVDASVSVNSGMVQVDLSDELIDQARSAPIRIEIPAGSQFSQVYLRYANVNNAPPAPGDGSSSQPPMSPESTAPGSTSQAPMHYVKLGENKSMAGQMDMTGDLEFATKFGDVDIAIGQIAGIRFHIDGDDSAVVVLRNGDSVTGVPAMDSIVLNTDWGRAEFDIAFIEALTTSPTARFRQQPDPEFGSRWQLQSR